MQSDLFRQRKPRNRQLRKPLVVQVIEGWSRSVCNLLVLSKYMFLYLFLLLYSAHILLHVTVYVV